jgi:hypothetical protein
MSYPRCLLLAFTALALVSCNPFHRQSSVQVSAKDANLNSRWHASLATPAGLAGAIQMNGSASMAPAPKIGNTTVSLDLANATPGGLHPWQLHRGQCGSDDGIVGSAGAYPVAKVGRDGHAAAMANLTLDTPTVGSYFVSVSASAANDAVTVACGNLAPPTL